ncbi:MAG: class I SAM-dependent methyltransferase [Candidatus Hodarchaeales archaeon]
MKEIYQSFDWAASYYDATRGIPHNLLWEILQTLRKKTDIDRSSNILEVGIGTGRISNYFAIQLNKQIIGIDISRKMLKICLENQKKSNIVQLVQADGRYLPFKLQFDIIITSHVIHLFQSKFEFLNNILRHLHADGYYVNIDAYVNYHETIPFKIYYKKLGGDGNYYVPKGELTRKQITIYLKNRGWGYTKEELNCTVAIEFNTILRFIKNQVFSHLRAIDYEVHRRAVEKLYFEVEEAGYDLHKKIIVPATAVIGIFKRNKLIQQNNS